MRVAPSMSAREQPDDYNVVLPSDQDVTYTWQFRGQPLAGNHFLASGKLLHVTVSKLSDVRSVNEQYCQC